MKVDGITLLAMARDNELKPKTILKTKHEKKYFDDRECDYYIYFGDNQFHRCNENGHLGSKYQNRFLNYEVLNKEFELIEPIEEKEIEELNYRLDYATYDKCKYDIDKVMTLIRPILENKEKINELVREVRKLKDK